MSHFSTESANGDGDSVSFTSAKSHFSADDADQQRNAVVPPLICFGHTCDVVDLNYSSVTSCGHFLITASKDKTARLWNGSNGDWIRTFEGHRGAVLSACLDNKAQIAATASADWSVKIWDAIRGHQLLSIEHEQIVRACALSVDNHLLTGAGFVLRVFDINRPKAPTRALQSPGSVRCATWLRPDTVLSSCTDTGGVRIWDLRDRDPFRYRTLRTESPVSSAEVTRHGSSIVTTDASSVKIWDTVNYAIRRNFEMPCPIESASLEPVYGWQFIAGGKDGRIHVSDFFTGAEIAVKSGHHDSVKSVRFAPNGETYGSASNDGTARIWSHGG